MREAIGGTWLTQIVIIFMLIFVAFLALTLNYTKAFKMKNDIITIIEEREGITINKNGKLNGSIGLINNYLEKNGYTILRACPEGSYGVSDLHSEAINYINKGQNAKRYYYCITKFHAPSTNYKRKVYYQVAISLKFNLPILGDLFTFEVTGNTEDITIPADNLKTK